MCHLQAFVCELDPASYPATMQDILRNTTLKIWIRFSYRSAAVECQIYFISLHRYSNLNLYDSLYCYYTAHINGIECVKLFFHTDPLALMIRVFDTVAHLYILL